MATQFTGFSQAGLTFLQQVSQGVVESI
ncbi:hypothetical protein PCC21_040070 [Pectobacterium carotovorum subsp. carotovorum PCC21]|nr:hypothetical protein PCC21_040070 [Pectobacterium carotovorum subsp. carotovorum PCC21]